MTQEEFDALERLEQSPLKLLLEDTNNATDRHITTRLDENDSRDSAGVSREVVTK